MKGNTSDGTDASHPLGGSRFEEDATGALIPGERDPTNLTHPEPGAIAANFGEGNPVSSDAGDPDAATSAERAREGGGSPRERRSSG